MKDKINIFLKKIKSTSITIFDSFFGYSEAEERIRETRERIMQLCTYNITFR